QEALAYGAHLRLSLGAFAGQPRAHRQATPGPQPTGRPPEEARLVEEVLAALNIPDDVEGLAREAYALDVGTAKAGGPADSVPRGRQPRPAALHRAEGHAGHRAAVAGGQLDRAAPHAASHIENAVSLPQPGGGGQDVDQAALGQARRFVLLPEAVVNVRPPEEPVERRGQVVVVSDRPLGDRIADDHDAHPGLVRM